MSEVPQTIKVHRGGPRDKAGYMLAKVGAVLLIAAQVSQAQAQCHSQQIAKLIASDAAGTDYFGNSVAVSGDTAVIGAYGAYIGGAAYVFVHSNGAWTQQAKLTAADAGVRDYFGNSVALSGDTAFIGSFTDTNEVGSDVGSTYVFVRSGGVWTQQTKLIPDDGASYDHFGSSVALSRDTAVIGSYYDSNEGGSDAGSAYVFVRTDGVWTQQAKLTGSDVAANDHFGSVVAVSGETAVIGAHDNDLVGSEAGAAYVFVRSGGVWTQQARLTAIDQEAGDHFGGSVAVSGDTAVIGAPGDDDEGDGAGAVYVFVRSGQVWTEQGKLIAADAEELDDFGYSVALSGDTVVIGAPGDTNEGGLFAGSTYVFVRSGGVWTQQTKLIASDATEQAAFGYSAAVLGDTGLVGAAYEDRPGLGYAGSAYVFDLGCLTPGDFDGDRDVDLDDYAVFASCLEGPTNFYLPECQVCDVDGDQDVDLADFARFQFILAYSPPGDFDRDGDVDVDDYAIFAACLEGPAASPPTGCEVCDVDGDLDVDLADFARFQIVFTN